MDVLSPNDISELRRKIENEDSVFSDKSQLDSLYMPPKLLGRKRQIEMLIRCFDFKNKYLVPFVSVYGRSGSGKSVTVRAVCQELSDVAEYRLVNLRRARTVFGCVNLILSELGGEELKNSAGLNKALDILTGKIREILERSDKRFFILVLDEYDALFSDRRGRPSDIVYKLLTLAETLRQSGLVVSLVTISNNSMIDSELDDRVKSRMGSAEVFFPHYTQDDVYAILKKRAQKAFSIKVDNEVLRHCAQISSADSGDARRAIDLLRIAGEICTGTITKQDVDSAQKYMHRDRTLAFLANSSFLFRLAFFSLARLVYLTEKQWYSTSDIYTQYCNRAISKNDTAVSYRRFSDILKELEQAGIVVSDTSSRGRYGMSTRFRLAVPTSYIKVIFQPDIWQQLKSLKKSRFEMLHNPKYNGSSYDAKYGKYSDQKAWRIAVGLDEYLDEYLDNENN